MITDFIDLLIPLGIGLVSMMILSVIESSRRLQSFYIFSQISFSLLLELGLLIPNYSNVKFLQHGIILSLILILHLVLKLLAKIIGSEIYSSYTLKLMSNNKMYYLQLGLFDLGKLDHPTLEYIQPLAVDQNGFLLTEYAEIQRQRIEEIFNKFQNHPDIELQIVQVASRTRLFRKFVLLAYTLIDSSKSDVNKNFTSIAQLEGEDHRFERIYLADISYRKVQRAILLDAHEKLLINPAKLLDSDKMKTIELGLHELEIISEIIRDNQTNQLYVHDFSKFQYRLGQDHRGYPVNIPEINSAIFLGSSKFAEFLCLTPFTPWLMISDNNSIIEKIQQNYIISIEDVSVVNYNDLSFEFLKMSVIYPKLFRLILQTWESIIPGDSKMGGGITSYICEFVEIQNILDNQLLYNKLSAKDLTQSDTYRRFNRDISDEAFAKLNPVLSLPIFNRKATELGKIWREKKNIIIDLTSSTRLEKLSLLLLLLVLQDQRIFTDRWLVAQLDDKDINLNEVVSLLPRFIQLVDVLMQMENVGNNLSLLKQFDLFVADHSMQNNQLRKYLFNTESRVGRLDINYNMEMRTLLEFL